MPHVQFAGKRQTLLGIFGIVKLLLCQVLETTVYRTEYFGNGTRTESTFTEHVFLARIGLQLHTRQPRGFLSSVVLLFHQQIELVQPVHPGTIFFLIIFQRLQQPNHCDTAFMF